MRSSSIYSEAGHKSVTSDEWIDLEEEEEEIEEDTDTETEHGSPTKNANFFTRAANARQVQFYNTLWQNQNFGPTRPTLKKKSIVMKSPKKWI